MHLKLSSDSVAIQDAVSDLQQKFPRYASEKCKPQIRGWLLNGPDMDVPFHVRLVVRERRKKMARFLLLEYGDAASPIAKFEVFEEFIDPLHSCDIKQVTSETELFHTISNFLGGAAKEVDMPVILVTGKGKKQNDQLVLQFSATDHTFADTIFEQYRPGNKELRMVFCCYSNGSAGDVGDRKICFFTNALPPETDTSENTDLKKYHCAIIKSGPKNKIIQLP